MKIVTIEGAWLLHCCTKFQLDISSRLWIIVVWKLKSQAHTHTRTRTHTHTSGCQLKIIFLDVLDYSEYSHTNTAMFLFSRKHSFFSKEARKFEISVSVYSEWSKTFRSIIFNWRLDVCVCVCVCVCVRARARARLSNFQTTVIHKRLEISSWNLVEQWSSRTATIVTLFMQIDA